MLHTWTRLTKNSRGGLPQGPTASVLCLKACQASDLRSPKHLEIVKDETENLRALHHPHIVALMGTYEDQRCNKKHFYCLLMSPVGDNELREFLDMHSEQDHSSEEKRMWGD
ncbi:hypothetical protein HBI24_091260 [Parastagonospora nodorum]|nr:hypothetical protein HBI09_076300 [Parastagonospora nodorum]KAH4167124.1 hypothetical protein HBH43_133550 [Parastagonospora nodorum]KAH5015519.1 hypothetical protein HBI77_061530 [Parastagonospora nodorum]KAH5027963.1 hypothetical protein HBI74_114770 [Parastagonospora nodorum]KAH5054507.1 hypothetical protein HBH96_135970 [Parastagonospora nodorum]